MKFEHLIYEEKDKIGWLTLNRPNVVNALSMKLSDELLETFELATASNDIKVFVIKGGRQFQLRR